MHYCSVQVSKEANAAIAKAASVFVLYATSSANGVSQKHNRKTITGPDVVSAMTDMDFDKFVRPLENSLAIWKRGQQVKKDTAAKKKAAATATKEPVGEEQEEGKEEATAEEGEEASAEEDKENAD